MQTGSCHNNSISCCSPFRPRFTALTITPHHALRAGQLQQSITRRAPVAEPCAQQLLLHKVLVVHTTAGLSSLGLMTLKQTC